MLFTQDIGIDLGTANTLVFVKGKGIVIREPSVVAVDQKSNPPRVVAVGTEAKEMIGRTPGSITAVRPLKDGVIADFEITAEMIAAFIKRTTKRTPPASESLSAFLRALPRLKEKLFTMPQRVRVQNM